jgi:hypothetical protein
VLFSVDPYISFPCETFLFTFVEGASEFGICLTGHIPNIVRAKEMVKKEHIGIPPIPGPQSRFDVDKHECLPHISDIMCQTLRLSFTKGRPVCGALAVIS